MGTFPSMTSVSMNNGGTITFSPNFFCNNCPQLTTIATFAGLATLSSTSSSLPTNLFVNLHVVCTNCVKLTIMGSFPNLATVTAQTLSFMMNLECDNCPKMVTLGNFPLLTTLNAANSLSSSTSSYSPSFSCTNCYVITTMGFTNLASMTANSNSLCYLTYSPDYSCENCGALLTLGTQASLTTLNTCSTGTSIFTLNPQVSCTNCSAITSMGNFANLPFSNSVPRWFVTPSFLCVDCPHLLTMGSFPLLTTISTTNREYGFKVDMNCTNCAQLTTATPFPNLASLPGSNFVHGFSFGLTATCTNCNSVTSLAQFNLLTSFMAGSPNPLDPQTFQVTATCTSCPSILQFGNFPKLLSVDQFGIFSAQYTCTNCNSLVTMGTMGGPASFLSLEVQDSNYILGPNPVSFDVQYTCTTCPLVTSFLDVSNLRHQYLSFAGGFDRVSPNMTIVATCDGCSSLPTFGIFSQLSNAGASAAITPSLTCIDCTALQAMGTFAILDSPTSDDMIFAPELECVNCPKLVTLGAFPALGNISIYDSIFFSPSLICNGCTNLTALGSFPLMKELYEQVQVGVQVTFTPTFSCTNCDSLVTLGEFDFPAFSKLSFFIFAPVFTCVSCSHLTSLGSFPAIRGIEVMAESSSPTILPFLNFVPQVTCESCPALTSLFALPQLQSLTCNCPDCDQAYYSAKLMFAPKLECDNCGSLTTFSDFGSLHTVTGRAPTSVVSFVPKFVCVNCATLVTLLDFPQLETMLSLSDFDILQYHSATCLFQVTGLCSTCGNLTRVFNLPSLESHGATSSFFGASFLPWYLDLECDNCDSLVQFASYPNLRGLGSPAVSSLRCATCPLLEVFHPFISPAVLNPNELSRAFTYTCSHCPELEMEVPGVYVFRLNVPLNFTASPGVVVGLKFETIFSDDFPVLSDSFSRLSSLEFNSVTGMTKMDWLWRVRSIDGLLSISNCPDLTQIEGLRVNLRKVTDVEIFNNMVLCPDRYDWLPEISTNIPVANNNFSPHGPCTSFEVLAALNLGFSVDGSGQIYLTWASPAQQQSVFVLYTLFMNNIPILSYYHANPISGTVITQTIPGATYLFTMTASLDKVTVASETVLTVSIPTLLTGCPPGEHKISGNCSPCPSGTYQSGLACIPCQKGFFYSGAVEGAFDPSVCQPCSQGSYTKQPMSSSCLPCGGLCPAGSMEDSAEVYMAKAFAISLYDKDGNLVEPVSDEILAWTYLVAFGGAVLILLLLAFPLKRWLKKGVSKVALVLRTPFSILFVGPDSTLMESPSYARGLIGLCVLLGVALVTAYQIHVFVIDSRIDLTAVQPGTTFADGTPTTSTTAKLRVNVTFLQSPVSCDETYSIQIAKLDNEHVTAHARVFCEPLSDTDTLIVGEFDEPVSFTLTSEILLTVTALEGTAMFTHALSYSVAADSVRERTAVMTETLVGDALLTSADVDLSTVPSEYLVDNTLVSVGYTYTFTSSSVTTDPNPTQSTFTATINMPSSNYFFQSRSVENISGLQFVAGVVALASGVITGGTVLANITSQAILHARRRARKGGEIPMGSSKENIL